MRRLDVKLALMGVLNASLKAQGLGDFAVTDLSGDYRLALVERTVEGPDGRSVTFSGAVPAETVLAKDGGINVK